MTVRVFAVCLTRSSRLVGAVFCAGLALTLPQSVAAAGNLTYNRDVRPILSDNCFHCHGPDKKTRKGKFRLDVREDAVAKGALVPGKPQQSELVTRIFATNQDDLMPPPEAHKTLTVAQKQLLKRWIAEGAKYEKHWAYVPPVKPTVPTGQNPIDALVRQRLKQVGLKPSAPADRRTLARRLYFDLVGLPPTPEEVEAFAGEKSPTAIAQLIEKLMARPQFGERMAIPWLDVVRFADTIGYHSDASRNVWPYRDYVIKAFNENKRFDEFTREQLAGDLLPNSSVENKVASAYNRLLLTTEEGGAQPKDYEARMLTDRVRDVSAVWLGQTIGCAQCHDHKFDPITQRDFYSLGAFFADINEPPIGARGPGMPIPNEAQTRKLEELTQAQTKAQKEFDAPNEAWTKAFEEWEKVEREAVVQERYWTSIAPSTATGSGKTKLSIEKNNAVLVNGKSPKAQTYSMTFTNSLAEVVGLRIEALPHKSLPGNGPGLGTNGDFNLSEVVATVRRTNEITTTISFVSARADFEQSSRDTNGVAAPGSARAAIDGTNSTGWSIGPRTNQPHQLVLGLAAPLTLQEGETLTIKLKQTRPGQTLGYFRIGVTTNKEALTAPLRMPLEKEFADLLAIPKAERDAKDKEELFGMFKKIAPETAEARGAIDRARKAKQDYEASLPHCLVTVTNAKPNTVRILPRGNFLLETGDIVQPALPVYLAGAPKEGSAKLTRLDLANFLVAKDNPLTARVVMNRVWKQFFGTGLSRVLDDLGAQGEMPPNQSLLDWLACEFMDSGWDMKHMVGLIVNSAVYQETSVASKALRARDPANRELAVQGRWRLDAELVRDNALAVSGLLNGTIGGPSVKPYQPDGYWENLNFPPRTYEASTGADQYRRGLYVWWQRSYLHPSLLAFDAPTREECAAERNRSNIPQQALALLNDPTYVEVSRALAVRILKEGGVDTKARLTWAWRQVLSRAPRSDELKTMQALLDKQLAEYRADPANAQSLLKIGMTPAASGSDPSELAAWTNLARVILNLHETITRS
jgi:hypothetical protein